MDRDIYAEAGHVSCEEAREILSRFIASHFDGRMGASTGERARFSVPANPRRDDDLRLEAFIQRVEKMDRELDAVRAERDEARARLEEKLREPITVLKLDESLMSILEDSANRGMLSFDDWVNLWPLDVPAELRKGSAK